jgi:hypothetical protein
MASTFAALLKWHVWEVSSPATWNQVSKIGTEASTRIIDYAMLVAIVSEA